MTCVRVRDVKQDGRREMPRRTLIDEKVLAKNLFSRGMGYFEEAVWEWFDGISEGLDWVKCAVYVGAPVLHRCDQVASGLASFGQAGQTRVYAAGGHGVGQEGDRRDDMAPKVVEELRQSQAGGRGAIALEDYLALVGDLVDEYCACGYSRDPKLSITH